MHRTKSSRSSLSKPFKSPKRTTLPVDTGTSAKDENATAAGSSGNHTPVPMARKRRVPSSAPPIRGTLGAIAPITPTPTRKPKRLRTPYSSTTATLGRSPGMVVPRLALRDEATMALFQEKTNLQRELMDIKEEVSLLERAKALEEKQDAKIVDGLIAKWQIACSSACDDLFELLKPMMEAQRQASLQGPGGFEQDEGSVSSGVGGAQLQQQEADEEEDIDIPYMLKRFGIDPELF